MKVPRRLSDWLYNTYWWLQRRLVPGLRYSQDLYEEALTRAVKPETRWLDLGCGHQALPPWRLESERQIVATAASVVGVDYDMPSLKVHETFSRLVRGDITQLPFQDGSFDLVTANMVVEHLDDPIPQFREICRLLAPSGVFLLHTPNAFGYTTVLARLVPEFLKGPLIELLEGRKEADVFRTYYRANSRARIANISSRAGFSESRIRMIGSSAMFIIATPVVICELLLIRLLLTKPFKGFRTNIIASLTKNPR